MSNSTKHKFRSIHLWRRSKSAEKASTKRLGKYPLWHKEDGMAVKRQLRGEPSATTSSYPSQWPSSSSSSSSSFTETFSKKKVDERLVCVYCSKRRRRILFYPCNHVLTCSACYKCLDECPQCDTKVEDALCLVWGINPSLPETRGLLFLKKKHMPGYWPRGFSCASTFW